MNCETGERIEELQKLQQDIKYILTTHKGSMPISKNFGTDIFDLLSKNLTAANRLNLFAEIYDAMEIYMPDLKVNNLKINQKPNGVSTIEFHISKNNKNYTLQVGF